MGEYDLTEEEKAALRAGDPRKLRQLGVHGMLCLYIKRLHPEFRDNIYWQQTGDQAHFVSKLTTVTVKIAKPIRLWICKRLQYPLNAIQN
jgi:hypothetical protein